MLSSLHACGLFITDRVDNVWNRNIVAGVRVFEIFLSHLSLNFLIVAVQCTQVVLLLKFYYGYDNTENVSAMVVLLLLQFLAGITCGIFISVICNTFKSAILVASFLLIFTTFYSGKEIVILVKNIAVLTNFNF